jgi:trehalose 6-phosphate phosphatase
MTELSLAEHHIVLPQVDFVADALLFDVDGTLLDIASEPNAVKSAPSLVANLARLQERMRGAVAFVSGRTLENLDSLFAPLKLTTIACHGAAFRRPDGKVSHGAPLPPALKDRLIAIAAIDPHIVIEDKAYSLAFHYRRAPQLEIPLLDTIYEHIDEIRRAGLNLLRGKCVVEIKPAGIDKGSALRRLMNFPPFASRNPIFAGDDRTDEDVFEILPHFGGLGISVGRRIAGAGFMVEQPRDIRHWLSHLAERA